MSVSARALSETIGAVYDAGLDTSGRGWPAVLDRMSRLVAGEGPVVLMLERRRFEYANVHYVRTDPADAARYQQYYARLDPVFEPLLAGSRVGDLLLSDALMSGPALRRTEFYTDWLRPLGLHSGAACVLMRHGSAAALLYAARPRASGPFTAAAREALMLLLPHCEVAVRTSLRLAALCAAGEAASVALDQCADAVLLVDGDAGVHWANCAAELLLGGADGLSVEPGRAGGPGHLQGARPEVTGALRRLVALTARVATPVTTGACIDLPTLPARRSLALPRPSGRPAYAAFAAPLVTGRANGAAWGACLASNAPRATVAVFVTDPAAGPTDGGRASRARLCAQYQLTPAEAAVAVAVAQGDGLRAVATAHRVTLATVRTQAQQVYRKTGVRGQAALARLVERMART